MLRRSLSESGFQRSSCEPLLAEARSLSRPGVIGSQNDTPSKPESRSSQSRYYRPELDILRFLAFLMVYLGHALDVSMASPQWLKVLKHLPEIGVPLFFALSAFLITELLTLEKRATGTVNVTSFYRRRILRIWPLYFVFLGTGFILSHVLAGRGMSWSALAAYLFFAGNWFTALDGYLPTAMTPLWSIAVEEQFYLFWPWIARYSTRRAIGIICFIAWFVSQATMAILCLNHAFVHPVIWVNSLVHLQFFAIGGGLSVYLNGSLPKIRGYVRLMMGIFAFAIFAVSNYLLNPSRGTLGAYNPSSITRTYPKFLLYDVSILLLLIAVLGPSALERFKMMQFLGKISYGLYVFHLPCLIYLMKAQASIGWNSSTGVLILGFPFAFVTAWLSYEYLEKPFLRMKEKIEIVKSRPA